MDTNKIIVSAIIIASIGLLGALIFWGTRTSLPPTDPVEVENPEVIREDTQRKGAENGKVTLVEFGDYQCPACASAAPIVNRLLEEYPGNLTFAYRHFPLPSHNHAELTARVAEASGKQDKFWEMHDILYERQNEWSVSLNPDKNFEDYAKELKLDIDKFKGDIKAQDITDKISLDKGDVEAFGLTSTPTFFINGEQIKTGFSYTELKQRIEEELAE